MAESVVAQEVKSDEKIENLTDASEGQVANTVEAIDLESKQISNITEVPEPVAAEVPGTDEDTQEVLDAEAFDEIEEEYEEEIEENGEVKVVIKKRKVKAEKSTLLKIKSKSVEEEVEEEYEEEEVDENGEVKIVTKKRIVKVSKKVSSKEDSALSFIEVEEEYEEEELDETGESKIVKKTRIVRFPKEAKESLESFEELEEEFEEEEVNESGETVKVTKKRIIKVPKKKPKDSKEPDVVLVEDGGLKIDSAKKGGSEEIGEEGLLEEEELEEEEVEEEEVEEEEEYLEERKLSGEETKKLIKKKKVVKEKVGSDDEDEVDVPTEKKIRRSKRKPKSIKEDETRKSKVSIETLEKEEEEEEEEEIEDKSKEELEEEPVKKSVVISVSSADLRQAEERAAISDQFEVLAKLRIENIGLKKKNFYLTNKLIHYLKKQKMDHAFAESKEDPEMEQRFFKKLLEFSERNAGSAEEKLRINTEWDSQRTLNEDLACQVEEGWENVITQKKEVAVKLIDPKTGRTIQNNKIVEDLISRQESQAQQMSECRLRLIKLKRRIEAKKEERQMDHMGADFNLMDYEKLSSLKDHFMDKIIDRDVEIKEVSHKMAVTEDQLEQVKKRLKLREEELAIEQMRLQKISADLNRKRASVNKVKATRHKTEKRTAKLKQESGLLAYPELMKDYEEKNQLVKDLTAQTDMLKQTYRNNGLRIRKLREIINKKSSARKSLASSSICPS